MKFTAKILFAHLLVIFMIACKKDKSVLGVDVQPAGDALTAGFSQTSPVYAYTLKYDSILSVPDRYKYLGINNDPAFGTTEVGLYTNANITDGRIYVSFGDDAQLVSSEIILTAYNLASSFVGSKSAQVSYSVHPVVKGFDRSKLYYTSDNDLHDPNVMLGTYTGSYTALNGKIVLRIPIDKNFASAILTNPQYLYNNASFQATYKGFYIRCSLTNDQGVITKFDLSDELSGFYLYYQNGTPSATKADKSFRFSFATDDAVRFNTVKHSFAGAPNPLVNQVINNDTAAGKDNLYLKGMGISRVKLFIPSLKSYSDSFNVAVNRAELVLNVDPSIPHGSDYLPPAKLALLPIDSLNRESFASDQLNVTDLERYGGTYDATTNQYVFNIARHVQAILSGKKKNRGFYLVVGSLDNFYVLPTNEVYVRRDFDIERVVLAGSAHSTLKPVFNLSYIRLKND